MNVLVTGANGFVGQALVSKLLARKQQVRACYRKGVGVTSQGQKVVTIPSINGSLDWTEVLEGIDVIIHSAALVPAAAGTSSANKLEFREVNTEGTINLAQQAARAGVKRLIFISSIKVNGESSQVHSPFSASDEPSPVDYYGQSKYEAEQGLRLIAKQSDLEIVIVRPPLIYGNGVKGNFAALSRLLRRGYPLPLGSVTKNRRSFVAIENLVDFLIVCTNHPQALNQTFLVSDGEDLSTAELLTRMGNAMSCPVRLFNVPRFLLAIGASILGKRQIAERLLGNLQVSIELNKTLLDWTPPLSVDEAFRIAFSDSIDI